MTRYNAKGLIVLDGIGEQTTEYATDVFQCNALRGNSLMVAKLNIANREAEAKRIADNAAKGIKRVEAYDPRDGKSKSNKGNATPKVNKAKTPGVSKRNAKSQKDTSDAEYKEIKGKAVSEIRCTLTVFGPIWNRQDTREYEIMLPTLKEAKAFVKEAFDSEEYDKIILSYLWEEQAWDGDGFILKGETVCYPKHDTHTRSGGVIRKMYKVANKSHQSILSAVISGLIFNDNGEIIDNEGALRFWTLTQINRFERVIAEGLNGSFKPQGVYHQAKGARVSSDGSLGMRNPKTTKVTFSGCLDSRG